MVNCIVYGCPYSTAKKKKMQALAGTKDNSSDEDYVCTKQKPIEIDDDGTVLDGPDIRFFRAPRVTDSKKSKGTEEEIKATTALGKQWILASGRSEKDVNLANAYICSRHFGSNAYNGFVKMKHGSYKTAPGRILKPEAVPTENLPKRKSTKKTERTDRQNVRDRRELVNAALNSTKCTNTPSNNDAPLPPHLPGVSQMSENFDNNPDLDYGERSEAFGHDQEQDQNHKLQQTKRAKLLEDLRKILDDVNKIPIRDTNNSDEEELELLGANRKTVQDLLSTRQELKNSKDEIKKLKQEKKIQQEENIKMRRELGLKNRELTEESSMRNKLFEDIKKAGGAVSGRKRNEIVEEVLEEFLSKSQIQKLLTKKRVKWAQEDIEQAIVLLGLSSRTYRYMRNQLKYPLPAVSTIRGYISKIEIKEGLITPALLMMRTKGKTMKELHKIACLTFDEIHLSSNAVYDVAEDQVLGCEDTPRKTQVLMARGIFSPWKNPVYFAHDTPVTEEILDEVISALHEAGFAVAAMTSDLGADNRGLLTKMGVTQEHPSFLHPITGGRIYCFADTPHLLKLARNLVVEKGATLNPDAAVTEMIHATRSPFEEILAKNVGREQQTHKITYQHINCKGPDRQIVSLATELLSDSTASTIESGMADSTLESPDSKGTARYCSVMNMFFDIFNTREGRKCEESTAAQKQPFGQDLIAQEEILKEVYEMVKDMRKKGGTSKSAKLPFQEGIMRNCIALPLLLKDLKEQFPEEENLVIFTQTLNQDILESFFSVIRAMGATYTAPNPLDFKFRLRRYLALRFPESIIANSTTNVQTNTELQTLSADVYKVIYSKECDGEIDLPSDEDGEPSDTPGVVPEMSSEEVEAVECDADLLDGGEELQEPLHASTDPSYITGIKSLAGIVAHRQAVKYPELSATGSNHEALSVPAWVHHFAKRGCKTPHETFAEAALKMDQVFLEMHIKAIDPGPFVVKRFVDNVAKLQLAVPAAAVAEFGRLRLYARIRSVNTARKNSKATKRKAHVLTNEENEATQVPDQHTRKAKQNKRWSRN